MQEFLATNYMPYSGYTSFMRRPYTKNLAKVDVAVSGIPFDLATTNRSGARMGPRYIRQASLQIAELLPYPWGFDIFSKINTIDYGDCFLDLNNPMTIFGQIKQHIANIINRDVFPLTLGGDHYITYPILCALSEKYGKNLSIIHFDAHCDTWHDEVENSLNHGTMFYKAIKNNIIDPGKSVQIGIRTWNNDFMGMNILDAAWVNDNGWNKTVEKIKLVVGDNPCYITFDIDCLDPAFAPGTGTPVAGGLTSINALSIIRNLPKLNIIGADVVEVAPSYDSADITSTAAAQIACDILALIAKFKV
ncbi:MAG: agmatinase [Pseudomonadota bacterium]|jgi:agmatinase|nr:agmatinase [Burkholderiales bacterium]